MKIVDKLNSLKETEIEESGFLSIEEVKKSVFLKFAKYILLLTSKTNDKYLLLTEIIPEVNVPEKFRLLHLRFPEFPIELLSPFNLEIPVKLGENDFLAKIRTTKK